MRFLNGCEEPNVADIIRHSAAILLFVLFPFFILLLLFSIIKSVTFFVQNNTCQNNKEDHKQCIDKLKDQAVKDCNKIIEAQNNSHAQKIQPIARGLSIIFISIAFFVLIRTINRLSNKQYSYRNTPLAFVVIMILFYNFVGAIVLETVAKLVQHYTLEPVTHRMNRCLDDKLTTDSIINNCGTELNVEASCEEILTDVELRFCIILLILAFVTIVITILIRPSLRGVDDSIPANLQEVDMRLFKQNLDRGKRACPPLVNLDRNTKDFDFYKI